MVTKSKGKESSARVLAAKRKKVAAAKKKATPKKSKPAAKKPAAKKAKPAEPKLLLKQLAQLEERSDSAGDASGLLGAQFALAIELVAAIETMKAELGAASAALYRELRTVIGDIIRVIESREEVASMEQGVDDLAILLGAHDDD